MKLTKENCLANKFPKLALEWDVAKNGDLKPTNVSFGSAKKVWWICPDCKESYKTTVDKRSSGRNCPFCAGKKVANWNSLSIKRPDIAKEWDYEKNLFKPTDVTAGSSKKAFFIYFFLSA